MRNKKQAKNNFTRFKQNRIVTRRKKGFLKLFLLCILFAFLITAIPYLPFVQNFITAKVENIINEKTEGELAIEQISLTPFKGITVTNVILTDPRGELIWESKKIKIKLSVASLLRHKLIVRNCSLRDIKTEFLTDSETGATNIDFLLDAFPADDDRAEEQETSKWEIFLNKIQLKNVIFHLNTGAGGVDLDADIGKLLIANDKTDLSSLNFQNTQLLLKDSFFDISIDSTSSSQQPRDSIAGNEFSELTVLSKKIQFKNNHVRLRVPASGVDIACKDMDFLLKDADFYLPEMTIGCRTVRLKNKQLDISIASTNRCDSLGKQDSLLQVYNFNAMQLVYVDLEAESIYYGPDSVSIAFKDFSFTDTCGFTLSSLHFDVKQQIDSLYIHNLELLTPNSKLRFDLSVDYDSIKQIKEIENLNCRLVNTHLDIAGEDVQYFYHHPKFTSLKNRHITLDTEASLQSGKLSIPTLIMHSNVGSHLLLHANCQDVFSFRNSQFSFILDSANLDKDDFISYLPDSAQLRDSILPAGVFVKGFAKGCFDSLTSDFTLQTSDRSFYSQASFTYDTIHYDSLKLTLRFEDFNLKNIVSHPGIDKINGAFHIQSNGLTKGINNISANGNLSSIHFNDSIIKDINIKAMHNTQDGNLLIHVDDEDAKMEINSEWALQDSLYKGNLALNIISLNALKFILDSKVSKCKGRVTSNFLVSNNYFQAETKLANTEVSAAKNWIIPDIHISSFIADETYRLNILSDYFEGNFFSNINPANIPGCLTEHFNYYMSSTTGDAFVSTSDSAQFHISLRFSDSSNLYKLIPELNAVSIKKFECDYKRQNRDLQFNLDIPYLDYQNIIVDGVSIHSQSDSNKWDYKIDIPKAGFDSVYLQSLSLSGIIDKKQILNSLYQTDNQNNTLYNVGFRIEKPDSSDILISLMDSVLILNGERWNIRNDSLLLRKKKLTSANFFIYKDKEYVSLKANPNEFSAAINQLNIDDILGLLTFYDSVINPVGVLNASYKSHDDTKIIDCSINDLSCYNNQMGDVTANMQFANSGQFNFNINLTDSDNTIDIEGDWQKSSLLSPLSLKLNMDFNDLSELEPFIDDKVKSLSGKMKANIDLKKGKNRFNANGWLKFENTQVHVNSMDSYFTIKESSISLANDSIHFNNFALYDAQKNNFTINGYARYKPGTKPYVNLKLQGEDFVLLDISPDENPDLNGKLIINSYTKITGYVPDIKLESVSAVNEGTDLVYALPPQKVGFISNDGVVEFVDSTSKEKDVKSGLQSYMYDSLLNSLNGLDITGKLAIDPKARFRLDIDKRSGDYIAISGEGDLNFDLDKSSNWDVNGIYKINKGVYQVSFYSLAKKTFSIVDGSQVSWTGDILAPEFDIQAMYEVRTSSYGLVSTELQQSNQETQKQYRKQLPYQIFIYISGNALEPVISFKLDLQEKYRENFPLVDIKLNRLNEDGNSSLLTQQVFGLLTLGSFIPEDSETMSGYGQALTTTKVTNSLNSILTNEMNKLSGKLLKNSELNFGMQSYQEGNSGEEEMTTTMDISYSKSLLNDRVTFEAEHSFDVLSQDKTDQYKNNTYDFSLMYNFSENSDYKLKLYNQSTYDIYYKDTRTSGLALIFIKDYDGKLFKKKRAEKHATDTVPLKEVTIPEKTK